LALLPATQQAQGQPTGFVIRNVDSAAYVLRTVSAPLNGLIANVAPRFVVESANGLHYCSLPPISSTLTALMAQVGDRFALQYANANRYCLFTYPLAMIGDTVPPQIRTPPAPIAYGNGALRFSGTRSYPARSRFTNKKIQKTEHPRNFLVYAVSARSFS
jgi:hypothetical protein